VSIKNKLVTAVTTAGLLAGLFGSAFVPSVRAASVNAQAATAAGSLVACDVTDTDVDSGTAATDSTTCYVKAGATIDLVMRIGIVDEAENDDTFTATVVTVTATGTTISSVGAGINGAWSIASNSRSATAYVDDVAALTGTGTRYNPFTLKVVAPAAGASATVVASSAAVSSLGDVTLIGVGALSSGIPAANKSGISGPAATDLDTASTANNVRVDADTTAAALTTLVAAGGARLADGAAPAIANGAEYHIQVQSFDAYNVGVTSAANGLMRATLTGTATGGITVTDTNVVCSDDSSTSASLSAGLDGTEYVCFQSDGDVNGSATITVTFGSLTYSRTFIVLGATDTVTIAGPTHIAQGLGAVSAFNDQLSVVCKDDAGTVIGDGGGDALDYNDGDRGDCIAANLTFTLLDTSNGSVAIPVTAADDAGAETAAAVLAAGSVFSDAHNYQNVTTAGFQDTEDTFSVADDGIYDLPNAICALGDAGETRTLQVQRSVTKKSNILTMTCVANKVKITGLTALATGTSGSATSGANGQTIKVSAAATDGAGRPAGLGTSFTFTATKSWTTAGTNSVSFAAGAATITITLPANSGAQYVIYSAADGDTSTTAAEAFAQKISFTVTNGADVLGDYSLTKKGSKVTGSNFSARATVKVEVENASKGTVKVYTRKADAAGRVVYTIAGRGTFYVTMYTGAAGAEVLSNTVTVKR